MKSICILAVSIPLCATACAAQFFPKDSLDLRGGNFKATWYSHQLQALNEPSLWEMRKDPSEYSYRFLWLRTFHHPIAIRLEVKPDGTGILTTKVASGAGGYNPGSLTQSTSKELTKKETDSFLAKVEKTEFWTAPNPVNDQQGTDGSQWIVEGVKNGKYHVIDRWYPGKGVARDLGTMLAFDRGCKSFCVNGLFDSDKQSERRSDGIGREVDR
jgi:hypothetical protein